MEGARGTGDRSRVFGGGDPENLQLRWVCRYLLEVSIGRRQNVSRMQQKPHGSCGSLEIRRFPDR
jgi:hypothetical protein